MEEFSYGDEVKTLWDNLIIMEQDRSRIYFDLENNDGYDVKTNELSYKTDDNEFRVKAQLCWAGGDWQNPICYFRCQFEGRMSFEEKWGNWNKKCMAIIIPIKSNLNLIKGKNGLVATNSDEANSKRKEIVDKDLWDEMVELANERFKKFYNEYASYNGDTGLRNTGCAKNLTDLMKSKRIKV
jgi:hypothetical protein